MLNGVINHATQSNKTAVTGGATVPATGIAGSIPALYAMSYTNATGGLSVVITNKTATAHQVTIRVNGSAATGTFPLQSTEPFPTTLGDTTISITGSSGVTQLAPLYYVAPSQASFLIPPGLAPGAASLKVTRSGSTVLTGSMTVAAVSPGLYSQNGNGAGVAAAAYVRTSAPDTVNFVFSCKTGVSLSCLSTPISLGAPSDTIYVTLYGTGIRGAKQVQAFVAGQSVPVFFVNAQGQFQGLDQINISLPSNLAGTGEASVYVVADGKASNMITIKVQ